ncbi:MAG: nucleotide exchange factor GrpE [Bacilli bacterium]|nr:nucleotide exchange factor GrpE [Bacilli bacterium]
MKHNEDKEINEEVVEPTKKEKKKIEKLEEEIAKLKSDAEHWKNEYYRAYADTKNLRNNLEKDHSEAMKYRAEGFIENLLPILDSFHLALGSEPEDPNLKNYLTGFQFIYKNLVSVLESEGVTEISPKINEKFDPNVMEAVDTVEDDGESNLIKKIYGKGYKLHDRLVRPAMVSVTKKKEEKKDNADA